MTTIKGGNNGIFRSRQCDVQKIVSTFVEGKGYYLKQEEIIKSQKRKRKPFSASSLCTPIHTEINVFNLLPFNSIAISIANFYMMCTFIQMMHRKHSFNNPLQVSSFPSNEKYKSFDLRML